MHVDVHLIPRYVTECALVLQPNQDCNPLANQSDGTVLGFLGYTCLVNSWQRGGGGGGGLKSLQILS